MGVLLVKCPVTEKEFSTGINADQASLVGLRAIVSASICPHCGAEHAWRVEDTRYVDANAIQYKESDERVNDQNSFKTHE
jgi:hypothetical protein